MNKHRIRKALLWLIGTLACYALAGFFFVPAIVKSQATKYVEHELGHKLDLGEIHFNPFTLASEVTGFDLKEASGASLVSFKRLFVNFQTSSLFRRAWTFAALEVDAPAARFELRPDGTHNFSALLAKLRKTPPEPDSTVPRIEIDRIQVSDGRIDVADLQAGQDARLALHPITFELTDLSTLPAETSPYKLVARSTDGEVIQWGGEITLNPFSSTGKLALQNWKLATLDRLLGNRIGLQSAAGQLGIVLDYRAAFAQGQTSVVMSNAQITIDGLALSASAGVPPLISMQRFVASGGSFDLTQRTLAFERIELAQAAIDLNIDADGKPNWAALVPQSISHRSATALPASAPAPTATPPAVSSTNQPAAPWSIKLPQVVASEIAFAYDDKRAASATTVGFSQGRLTLAASAQVGTGAPTANIDNLSVSAAQAALGQAGGRLALGAVELSATQLKLAPTENARQIELDALKLVAKAVAAQQGAQSARIDALDLSLQSAAVVLPAAAVDGVRVRFSSAALESKGITARAGAKTDAIEIKALTAGAKQVLTDLGSTLQIRADDLRAGLDGVLVRDPVSNAELARLGKLDVVGGMLTTDQQTVTLERVSVSDVVATATYARDGKFNWDALVAAFTPPKPAARPAAAAPTKAGQAANAGWNATVKLLDVNKVGAAYNDARQQPALALAIQDVSAKLRNASTQGKTPADVELAGRIKDSGQFRAAGTVDLKTLAADLKLKLDGISLTIAQPFIAQRARLQLVSALASAEGRLRYGKPKEAGAGIVYEGALGLDKVVLEETEPAQPFLSLDTLRASQIKLTLGPDSLDVPDLRLNRLNTKLAIAEDQSVNLVKVLRAPPGENTAPVAPPASAPAPAKPAPDDAEASFPISLARIRIDNSVLEFSDLSLRPQLFSTRMHELQGVITGVSTSRDSRARLELDARVDEFGAAIIRGALNPFKPRVFTEVDLDFRNIAMTNLTPYSTKFAGYRIASGTLTMSLQYRVRNSALQGNNKIVLDKLELGERVESPTALNLPLELAIAILKDSDGRIDIGLPVSGSLEDPQFSLAGIVWKAIGNLLTRIVTAPFRALASLFGGGESETLGAIEFDPGSEALRPPERQKLRTVAEALQKRQQLKLTVKPSYAANADREALKSLSVRRAVLIRAGIKLEPGESPGPLDVGNARMQQAIDSLYVERFGLPAARDLRASLTKTPPAKETSATEGAKAPANPAGLQAIRIARAMSERLIEAAQVSDAELAELGRQRGIAVLSELREAGKVDPTRLISTTPSVVEPKNGPVVTDLDLSVAK